MGRFRHQNDVVLGLGCKKLIKMSFIKIIRTQATITIYVSQMGSRVVNMGFIQLPFWHLEITSKTQSTSPLMTHKRIYGHRPLSQTPPYLENFSNSRPHLRDHLRTLKQYYDSSYLFENRDSKINFQSSQTSIYNSLFMICSTIYGP